MLWLSSSLLRILCLVASYCTPAASLPEAPCVAESVSDLYHEMGLDQLVSYAAFSKGVDGIRRFNPAKSVIAICDFTKPSTTERFFVIDLQHRRLIASSLVAHGRNSGLERATHFSNRPESNQSSLGFYRIGPVIQSPKHGQALLLDGLESALNGNARARQIIIHGADYVCRQFVKTYGYLGRSLGCPALPNNVMKSLAPVLANGSLLYIYGGENPMP
jgi:hypothetical protein